MTEPRKRVSYSQLEILWEYLNRNKHIALGFNKTTQAREFAKRMWQDVALALNSQGAVEKDWKGWCKYWIDFKSKLRRSAADKKNLTGIEKKYLQIVGHDYGSVLLGIKVDPFEEETPASPEPPQRQFVAVQEIENSSPEPSPMQFVIENPVTLSPEDSKPPVHVPNNGIPPRGTQRSPPGSQSVPRHRRRRVEKPVKTVGRRLVVNESRRRADIEERNTELLRELVNEVKEIKQILLRPNGSSAGNLR